MALGKQAKVLTKKQIDIVYHYLGSRRYSLRDRVIFLLSVKAGLRAKEIAGLTWDMVLTSEGELGRFLHLRDCASKGKGGRVIALNTVLFNHLSELHNHVAVKKTYNPQSHIITTERSAKTNANVIANTISSWYSNLNLVGCSSHSGRRTFITNAARKIGSVGGSIRDVQMLAGHASLQTTQRYIEADSLAQQRIIEVI